MATNTKIRTEDVVEILDAKIKTSSAHAQLDVAIGEFYDSVLVKIADRSPTLDQKNALDNTTFPPSTLNPYVTSDELALEIEGSIPWKTIGNVGSGADFEGDDENPFVVAFATVPTDIWFLVMAGTYTFTAPVTIPAGVRLVGAHTSSTVISSSGGVFNLSDDVYISYMNLISTDIASPVVSVAGTDTAEIRNCMISATDTSQTVDVAGAINFSMSDTALFFGTLSGAGLTSSNMTNMYVDSVGVDGMNLAFPTDVAIWGSTFFAGTLVIDSGTNVRVVGNHFNNATSNTTPISSVVFRANTPNSNNNEDEALTALLQYLVGSPSATQNTPSYSSNFAGPQAQDLTARASALDLLLQWKYEERNLSLITAYDRDDDIEIAQGETTSIGQLIGYNYGYAQTFIPLKDGRISDVQIYFNEVGIRPDCNILVRITEVSGGEPSTVLGSSDLIPTSSIISGDLNTIPLLVPVEVEGGIQYAVSVTLQDYEEEIDYPTGSIGTVNLDTLDHKIAQSIFPKITGFIGSVQVGLGLLGSLVGTDIVVDLVEMSGGEPVGAVLGTSNPIPTTLLVASPAHAMEIFTFPTPVAVVANTEYAVLLRYVIPTGSIPDPLNHVQCSYNTLGSYFDGHVLISDDWGATWLPQASYDLTFSLVVDGHDPANYLELVGSTTSTFLEGNLFTDLGTGSWLGDVSKDVNMVVDFRSTEVLLVTWDPSTNTLATSRDMYLVSAHRDSRWVLPEISPTVIPEGEFLYYILDRSLSGGTGDITLTPNVAPIGSFPLETNPPTGHPDNRQIITLAFNHGGTLWWRGGGGTRFPAGETGEYFVDGTSKNILTYLGALDYNDSDPHYSHNFAGAQGESLTMRLSHNDTLIKRLFEHSNLTHYLDDNSFISSEGTGSDNLTLTGTLYFLLPHKTGRIIVNPQSWTLADGELLYLSWDHTDTLDQLVDMGVATTVPLPDENLTTKYFVVAKRVGDIITLWNGIRLPDGGKWPVPKGRSVVPTGAPVTLEDNITWDGTNILWEKNAIVCDGISLDSNLLADQTTPSVGLTDLVHDEGLLITHTWLEQSPSSKYVTIEKVVLPVSLLESNQFLWVQVRDNYLIIT